MFAQNYNILYNNIHKNITAKIQCFNSNDEYNRDKVPKPIKKCGFCSRRF